MADPTEDDVLGAMRIRHLSSMAYGDGFTLWHYAGRGLPLARMMVPGFFDGAAGHIKRHDWIMLSGTDGGAIVSVNGPAQGANYTVSPLNQIAALAPQENACPTINHPPRAPRRLLLRLRRLASLACLSR